MKPAIRWALKYQQYSNKLYVGFLFVYRRLSLKPVDEQDRSLSVLTGYLETVMTSILGSIKECPSYMRAAFRNLARRVSDHFGDEPEYEVGLKPLCFTKKKNKQWHLGSINYALPHALSSIKL